MTVQCCLCVNSGLPVCVVQRCGLCGGLSSVCGSAVFLVQAVLAQHAAQEEAAEVASQQSPPHRYTPHRYTAHHTHLHCTQCTMCTADIYTPHCTHVHCTQQQQLSSGAQARAALNDLHRAEAELAELQRMHALQQCKTAQVEATRRPVKYLRGLWTTRLPSVPLGVWFGCNWSTGGGA